MKKAKRVVAVLMVCAIVLSLCACSSDKNEIQMTVDKFESSCKSMNISQILNCIDPSVGQPVKVALAVLNAATGQDTSGLLKNLVSIVFNTDLNAEDLLKSLDIKDCEIKISGKNAVVDCKIGFEVAGVDFTQSAKINMVKKDDEWYISGIELSKN